MAIDIEKDELFTLRQAAKLCPKKDGRKPSHCTLHRWSTYGVHGVILETVQIAGHRCTTRGAMTEFFRRLTEESSAGKAMRKQNNRGRKKAAERAGKELERAGI